MTLAKEQHDLACRLWRHKKRGTIYQIVGFGTMQTDKCEELDNGCIVHYQAYGGDDKRIWDREISEFTDGRFEPYYEPGTPDFTGLSEDDEGFDE